MPLGGRIAKCVGLCSLGCLVWAQSGRDAQAAPGAASAASYLGVGVIEVTPELGAALGVPDGRGVEITVVEDGSPAARAGLRAEDVVVEFNGRPVDGVLPFVHMVQSAPAGRRVRLLVRRPGSSPTVAVVLGRRRAAAARAAAEPPEPDPAVPNPLFGEFPGWLPLGGAGLLGIEVETLTPQLADYFGVKAGVLVRAVRQGSAADRAGMKAGDVIVRVGESKVATTGDLLNAEATARAGSTCAISISRDRKPVKISAVWAGEPPPATPVRFHPE